MSESLPLADALLAWLTLAAEPVPVAHIVQWAATRGAASGETHTALATLVRAGRATSTGETEGGVVRRWFAAVGAR